MRFSIFNTAEARQSKTWENATKTAEAMLLRNPHLVCEIRDERGHMDSTFVMVDGEMVPEYNKQAGERRAA